MPLISPGDIALKAERAYPRFLAKWIAGQAADFFPIRVPARLSPDPTNPRATIAAHERLLAKSKDRRGWGYSVHSKQVRSRNFGNNAFPQAVTIDTLKEINRNLSRPRSLPA